MITFSEEEWVVTYKSYKNVCIGPVTIEGKISNQSKFISSPCFPSTGIANDQPEST